jgi:hypothetical protein
VMITSLRCNRRHDGKADSESQEGDNLFHSGLVSRIDSGPQFSRHVVRTRRLRFYSSASNILFAQTSDDSSK